MTQSQRYSQWRSSRLGRKGIAIDTVLIWILGIATVTVVLFLLIKYTTSTRGTMDNFKDCKGGMLASLGGKPGKCAPSCSIDPGDGQYLQQLGKGIAYGCPESEYCCLVLDSSQNPASAEEIGAAKSEGALPGTWWYSFALPGKTGAQPNPLSTFPGISPGGELKNVNSWVYIYYKPNAEDVDCSIKFPNGAVATYINSKGTCAQSTNAQGMVTFQLYTIVDMYKYANSGTTSTKLDPAELSKPSSSLQLTLVSTTTSKQFTIPFQNPDKIVYCPLASDQQCQYKIADAVKGTDPFTQNSGPKCIYYPALKPAKCKWVEDPTKA